MSSRDQEKPQEDTEVQGALVKMEALDEQQITESLRGRIISRFFYEFKAAGKEVVGISWAGIKQIASKMVEQGHAISVVDLRVEETDSAYKGYAKAKDLYTQEERWGASEQNKAFSSGDRNQFALPLCVSKAQRNAIKQFIPEATVQEAYKEWKQRTGEIAEPPAKTEIKEGTKTPSESPVPPTTSPVQEGTREEKPTEIIKPETARSPAQKTVTPKLVPLTAELRSTEGVKQFPLERDGRSYGTINWAVDGSELAIIPEHAVKRDCAPVGSLIYGPRSKTFEGLEQMKTKHGFAYHVEVQNGVLKWIILQGTNQPIDEKHVKQLQSTARWAFENAPKGG